jgi:hypothetical protein
VTGTSLPALTVSVLWHRQAGSFVRCDSVVAVYRAPDFLLTRRLLS